MNRAEFIKELEYLLQDIPDAEREDAIAYYRDYLEEAGDEHEADAIAEFGSPERVAAIIRADLAGQLENGGAFTDSGYQDERFRDPRYQVAQRRDLPEECGADGGTRQENGAGGSHRGFGKSWRFWERGGGREAEESVPVRRTFARTIKVILMLVLLCLLAPLVLGIGKGMVGFALAAGLLVIVAVLLAGVLTALALIGAVVLLVIGVSSLVVEFWTGIVWIGAAIFLLGLGLIGIAVSYLIYGKLLPWCICGIVDRISGFLHRGRRSAS